MTDKDKAPTQHHNDPIAQVNADKEAAGNAGINDATSAGGSKEAQIAEAIGSTEGEVRQAVRESGMVNAAGTDAARTLWEQTQDGKDWLEGEDERQKAIKAEGDANDKARKDKDDGKNDLERALEDVSSDDK